MAKGFFITGTDTGVGKTRFACALARVLRDKGLKIGVMKPVETGCSPVETGCSPVETGGSPVETGCSPVETGCSPVETGCSPVETGGSPVETGCSPVETGGTPNEDGLTPLVPKDALALREAASSKDPIELICPYRFALPVAPSVAARAKGVKVELEKIKECFVNIASGKDVMIVEGAGGLLVPINDNKTIADIALALELPLVIVAPSRLGCINSTLLTVKAAEGAGLKVKGVILNHTTPEDDESTPHNRSELEGFGVTVLGEMGFLKEGSLCEGALKGFDVDALYSATGRPV